MIIIDITLKINLLTDCYDSLDIYYYRNNLQAIIIKHGMYNI